MGLFCKRPRNKVYVLEGDRDPGFCGVHVSEARLLRVSRANCTASSVVGFVFGHIALAPI